MSTEGPISRRRNCQTPATQTKEVAPDMARRRTLQGLGLMGLGVLTGAGVRELFREQNPYSELIRRYKLEPYVLTGTETPEQCIELTVSYLIRVQAACKEMQISLPTMQKMGVTHLDCFPIAVWDEWSIADIVNILLMEVEVGKTTINYREMEDDRVAECGSDLVLVDQEPTRHSVISFGESMIRERGFDEGEPVMRHYSDLELAIILVHEFSHGLQDEAILQEFLETDGAKTILSQPDPDFAEIKKAFYEHRDQSLAHAKSSLDETLRVGGSTLLADYTEVLYSEAQGNALACAFLHMINTLNENRNGGHIPGSAYNLDPSGHAVDIHPLYKTYLRHVVQGGDPLDDEWLKYYVETLE